MARYNCCYFTSLLLLINILELGSAFFVPTRTTTTTTRIALSLLFTSSSSDDTKNVVDRDEIGNTNAPRPTANNNDHVAMPETTTTTTTVTPSQQKTRRRKIAILLCPAQFCVPVDYDAFLADVSAHCTKNAGEIMQSVSNNNNDDATTEIVEIVASRVAPLPRTEWIKVAGQLPTLDFINGNLSVRRTLDWYFRAMDAGLSDLLVDIASSSNTAADDDHNVEICIIGHSIGGWVARAYLGGLSGHSSASTAIYRLLLTRQRQQPQQQPQQYKNVVRISSLITLGTPHTSSPNAIVDQTRGLLREIEMSHSCSAKSLNDELGISITCVGSSGIYCFGSGGRSGGGGAAASSTSFMESVIATASYLPLVGKVDSTTCGDGIVPYELSYIMDDDDDDDENGGNSSRVRRINIRQCSLTGKSVQHAHVIPTPWNLVNGYAPSYKLSQDDDSSSNIWYGSPGVLRQWIEYI